jgi:aryl-alcohol dehydrogenase-like predicted oxidoreductase
MKRIALGTAQFGLNYGVSNKRGLIPEGEVFEILDQAAAAGVDMLDTAQAYGGSEGVLGRYAARSGRRFKVVTKLKDVPAAETARSLAASLSKTGESSFYGVLLHSYEEYAAEPEKYGALLEAQGKGLALKTGFSLYYPEQAELLLSAGLPVGMVQVPYSVLDRRFERLFPAMKKAGVEIHVRSMFMQGALLMSPETLPGKLAALRPKVERLRACAGEWGLSLPALCAAFALGTPAVDRIVMGVDGLESFRQNLAGLGPLAGKAPDGLLAALDGLQETDENLILPQNWNK